MDQTVTDIEELQARGLLGGDEQEQEAAEPYSAPSEQVEILKVSWEGYTADDVTSSNELALRIGNVTDEDLTVAARVSFGGLINKTAFVDLGQRHIDAGGSVVLPIPADDIPIQTTTGACQAIGHVSVVSTGEGGPVESPVGSVSTFYRHAEGFQTLSLFSAEVLVYQFGGMLSGDPQDQFQDGEFQGAPLGWMKDGEGQFVEVSTTDDSYATVVDGQVIARHIATEVGSEVVEMEEETEETDDDTN